MPIDATIALVSLADAKAFLKITASTEDTILGDMVNHCSAWINKFCDRAFLSAERTEYYDGDPCEGSLVLRQFPVTAIGSLYEDTLHVFGITTLIASTNYYLIGDIGEIVLYNQRTAFLQGRENLKVTYTAGYTLATMPSDLQMACKVLVSYSYRNMYSQWRVGVASETIGQKTTTFDKMAMPKEVEGILKPYRKIKVGY